MTNSNNSENSVRAGCEIREKARNILKKARPVLDIIIPIFILLIGVGCVIYYIVGPSKYYITGDSTDSLRWAQASFESGKLISDNFAYAAILPIGGNLIFYPFIAAFGYSMTAQICGLTVFTLILAAAMYYMATGIGFNRYASSGLVSITFLIMSSSAKLREIMWEHIFYYNLGILFFCFGVGLVSRLLRHESARSFNILTKEGRRGLLGRGLFIGAVAVAVIAAILGTSSVSFLFIVLSVIVVAAAVYLVVTVSLKNDVSEAGFMLQVGVLAVFSVLAAMDGLQTLACFTIPIFAGIFFERLFDTDTPVFSRKNICSCAIAAVLLICSGIGYLLIERVTGGVTAGYADAYSSYSAMSSWTNNFLGFFRNWFSLMGVSVVEKDPLVSKESIVNILRIGGSLVLLVIPFILLFFYKNIKSKAVKITLWGHFGVSAFILFGVTFGRLGGANWRLTPMLGTSVLVACIAAFELIRQKKGMAIRFGALILCLLIVLAVPSALEIKKMETDTGDNVAWHIAAEELESRGLKYGYANFWFAETITLLSDNKVQVSNIYESQAKPYAYVYQINKDAFDDKEDAEAYFLLLTEKENDENMAKWLKLKRSAITDKFVIETPGYDLRGHTGTKFYVYVFSQNIFYRNSEGSILPR